MLPLHHKRWRTLTFAAAQYVGEPKLVGFYRFDVQISEHAAGAKVRNPERWRLMGAARHPKTAHLIPQCRARYAEKIGRLQNLPVGFLQGALDLPPFCRIARL